jgi:hypothetical protein
MRRHQIALPLALLLWTVPACTAWHVEEGISPQQLIATKKPAVVRVTLADRSQLVLHEPTIAAGDTLVGIINGAHSSVAASDVRQIAVRAVSSGKTAGAVLGVGALAALVALGIALGNMCILSC